MAITFNRHLTPLKITRLSNSRKNCKSCAFNVSQALMSAKSLWWSSYQKSFLDLGFWYCICQLNQYIYKYWDANAVYKLLSLGSLSFLLSAFSFSFNRPDVLEKDMRWQRHSSVQWITYLSTTIQYRTEWAEAYFPLIRKTRKSGYQPANIIW